MAGKSSEQKRRLRERLFMKQGGFCYYCLKKMNMGTPPRHPDHGTLDHVNPLCKGGHNGIDNLVLACFRCNHLKANLTESQFRHTYCLESM